MDRVQGEPFAFDCPLFACELAGCQTFERLQPAPEGVGADDVGEVLAQLVVAVEAFDSGFLDRAVPLPGNGLPANRARDPFNTAIRSGAARQALPGRQLPAIAERGCSILVSRWSI